MQPSAPAPQQQQPQYIERLPEPAQPTMVDAAAKQAADEQKLIDNQAKQAVDNNNSAMAKRGRDTYVRVPGASSNYLGS